MLLVSVILMELRNIQKSILILLFYLTLNVFFCRYLHNESTQLNVMSNILKYGFFMWWQRQDKLDVEEKEKKSLFLIIKSDVHLNNQFSFNSIFFYPKYIKWNVYRIDSHTVNTICSSIKKYAREPRTVHIINIKIDLALYISTELSFCQIHVVYRL